jgi:hypothetical protein
MLGQNELRSVMEALGNASISRVGIRGLVEAIRRDLNPHPSGQKQENVPRLNGQSVPGIQHKYRETVLYFPTEVRDTRKHLYLCTDWIIGSVLPFILHLLLSMGAIHGRRLRPTVSVQ